MTLQGKLLQVSGGGKSEEVTVELSRAWLWVRVFQGNCKCKSLEAGPSPARWSNRKEEAEGRQQR